MAATAANPATAAGSVVVLPVPELTDDERATLRRHGGRDGQRSIAEDRLRSLRFSMAPGEITVLSGDDAIAAVEAQRGNLEKAGLVVEVT